MASNYLATAELTAALVISCAFIYPILCRAISGSFPLQQSLEEPESQADLFELR
ncbi:MAG: hypothetical protein AAFY20_08865 [Cyanobacteria bacterium J06639_14]